MSDGKEFMRLLRTAPNRQKECIRKLRDGKGRGIQTVLYGAGLGAVQISAILQEEGVSVDACLVDDEYLASDGNLIKEVVSLSWLCKQGKKCYIVMTSRVGVQERIGKLKARMEAMCDGLLQDVLFFEWDLVGLYEPMTIDYIEEHRQEFGQLYRDLSDQLSKESLVAYLNTKLTMNPEYLWPVYREGQYFCEDIFRYEQGEVIVDGGAYVGDTLQAFCGRGVSFRTYYAFEPDPSNQEKLQEVCRQNRLEHVKLMNRGLWSRPDTLTFQSRSDSSASLISDVGEERVLVTDIDGSCPDASFIKLDIEGAELAALQGARRTIRKNRPRLAICVYHKREDLLEIPSFLRSLVPEYRFYLRQHGRDAGIELVLYAVAGETGRRDACTETSLCLHCDTNTALCAKNSAEMR